MFYKEGGFEIGRKLRSNLSVGPNSQVDCLSAKAATGGNPVCYSSVDTPSNAIFFECIRTRKRLRTLYNPESFSTKSTFSGGINRIYDEIPHAWDEIRLDGGWGDLISSKLGLDFICHRQISSRSDFIIAFP